MHPCTQPDSQPARDSLTASQLTLSLTHLQQHLSGLHVVHIGLQRVRAQQLHTRTQHRTQNREHRTENTNQSTAVTHRARASNMLTHICVEDIIIILLILNITVKPKQSSTHSRYTAQPLHSTAQHSRYTHRGPAATHEVLKLDVPRRAVQLHVRERDEHHAALGVHGARVHRPG